MSINTTAERLEARNFFICRYLSFYEQLKFSAQLSWVWKKVYNLRASTVTTTATSLWIGYLAWWFGICNKSKYWLIFVRLGISYPIDHSYIKISSMSGPRREKPDVGVPDQVKLKSAHLATETCKNIEILHGLFWTTANKNRVDQTVWMQRLAYAFVIRVQQSRVSFLIYHAMIL